jgi:outer membrane immunogenic protein
MHGHIGWALASAVTLGIAGLGAASAADMAVKARPAPVPVDLGYNWSGWYVGVNGGWAWDDSTGRLDSFTAAFGPPIAGGAVPTDLGAKREGGFGGGQVGYN